MAMSPITVKAVHDPNNLDAPYVALELNPVDNYDNVTVNWRLYYYAEEGYEPISQTSSNCGFYIGDQEKHYDFTIDGKNGRQDIAQGTKRIDKDSEAFQDIEIYLFFGFSGAEWTDPSTGSKITLDIVEANDILSIPYIGYDNSNFSSDTCTIKFHKGYIDEFYNYSLELESDDTFAFPEPKRTGYTFKGWRDDRGFESVYWQADDEYTVDYDWDIAFGDEIIFYAEWEELSECTITYDANGGIGAPSSVTKRQGEKIIISSTVPTKTGYRFLGWTESLSDGLIYNPNSIYTVNGNVTLYAAWYPKTYTITYNANGGYEAPTEQKKWHSLSTYITDKKPYRTGYKFLGWSLNKNGDVDYNSGDQCMANYSFTLYAVWAESPTNIEHLVLYRCDSDGNKKSDGNCVKVSFDYASIGMTFDIKIKWRSITDYESYGSGREHHISTVLFEGYADTFEVILNNFNSNKKYGFRIEVYDSGCDYNQEEGYNMAIEETILSNINYFMDFKSPSSSDEVGSMGIGREAEEDGVLDIGYQTRFIGGILFTDLPSGVNFNDLKTPNNYTFSADSFYSSSYGFPESMTGKNGTLLVEPVGTNGDVRQIAKGDSTKYEKYERYFKASDDDWTSWRLVYSSDFGKVIESGATSVQITNTNYFDGTPITVSPGTYIVTAKVNFGTSNGERNILGAIRYKKNSQSEYKLLMRSYIDAGTDEKTLCLNDVFTVDEETKIVASKRSNVAETAAGNLYIYATRIA